MAQMTAPERSRHIVVKQHGGRIDVETESGEFTEFIITLPRGNS
jgi:two-component system, NtrC family, sensor kinase